MEDNKQASKTLQEMILRDYLALDRTRLANDRTLLSFLRTSLYLLATAIAFFELESLESVRFVTWLLISASAASFVVGVVNYVRMKRKINNYYSKQSCT